MTSAGTWYIDKLVHQAHTWYIDKHVGKAFIHTK